MKTQKIFFFGIRALPLFPVFFDLAMPIISNTLNENSQWNRAYKQTFFIPTNTTRSINVLCLRWQQAAKALCFLIVSSVRCPHVNSFQWNLEQTVFVM